MNKILLIFLIAINASVAHTWTNNEGQSFDGELVGISLEDKIVSIRRASDRRLFKVPLDLLSEEDQKFINKSNIVKEAILGDAYTLLGNWSNVDSDTGGITRVHIRYEKEELKVHMWGRCHPTECDWGETSAAIITEDDKTKLLIVWNTGFSVKTQKIRLTRNKQLEVHTNTKYKDPERTRGLRESTNVFAKGISRDWSDPKE